MTRVGQSLVLVAALVLAAGCDRQPVGAAAPAAPRATLNQAPVARVNLTVLSGVGCGLYTCAGYNYRFDAYESTDADGTIVTYEWVEDGVTVSTSATYYVTALRAYEGCTGTERGTLIVTDDQGATGSKCYGYTPI